MPRPVLEKHSLNIHVPAYQRGAILILVVFILGLASIGYIARSFSVTALQLSQDRDASVSLSEAKAALIGYTISRMGAGERPGDMPLPDRLITPTESPPAGGPPNYDGVTDSCTGSGAAKRCLGRLPWKTLGLSINSPSQNDGLGYMPWYAVSANLVDPTCLSVLNPGILALTYSSHICGSLSALPHPWLTVRDHRGNILSNRVAVVLILPGKPLGNQSRPSSALAGSADYLDTYTVEASCMSPCVPGTYSNSDSDNDFIMASPLTSASTSSNINDRLLYITIDELMVVLEKRVGKVAAKALKTYRDTNGYYPYASQLGTTSNYSCEQNQAGTDGLKSGMLPVDHHVCTVTATASSSSMSCDGKTIIDSSSTGTGITVLKFTRALSSPAFSGSSGIDGCSVVGSECSCAGEGVCVWWNFSPFSISTFTSSETSAHSTNVTGSYAVTGGKFTSTLAACTHGNFPTKDGLGCSLSNASINCSGGGTFSSCGDARFDTYLPAWFRENNWQDYIYYQMNRPVVSSFVIGSKPVAREAVIVSTGIAITASPFAAKGSAQIRPSCNALNNYLDSAENTDNDTVFEDTTKPRESNYNDQVFIVAPE